MLTGRKLKQNHHQEKKKSSWSVIMKITRSFLFRCKSFQSKAAARAPLLMAAILFFPVHEHKEFWSLSLIGSTFDSAAGTCCITVHTKFHAILARFLSPRRVPSISFSWNLCDMSPAGTKYHPSISLHEGESRCNISLGHVPANVVSFVPSAWNNRSYRIRERIKRQVEKKYRTTHLLTHCQHFASLTYDFAQRRHHTGHDLITTIWQSIWQGAGLRFSPRVLAPAQVNKSLLLYGSVSQGLGTTKFTNLIG